MPLFAITRAAMPMFHFCRFDAGNDAVFSLMRRHYDF